MDPTSPPGEGQNGSVSHRRPEGRRMKILLAVDGSKNSLDAVASLIKHADWFSAPPAVRLGPVGFCPTAQSPPQAPVRSRWRRWSRISGFVSGR